MKQKNSALVMPTEPKDTLSSFRSGDGKLIATFYNKYRGEFINFSRLHFSLSEEDAVEIYQESFIALYENIKEGKLTKLTSSLKTYLFRIGYFKMINFARDVLGKRMLQVPESFAEAPDEEWDPAQRIAYTTVQAMEEPCNTVLTLYYWDQKSLKEIADAIGYKSEQVAKNRKLSCMRKLKIVLKEKLTTENLM